MGKKLVIYFEHVQFYMPGRCPRRGVLWFPGYMKLSWKFREESYLLVMTMEAMVINKFVSRNKV